MNEIKGWKKSCDTWESKLGPPIRSDRVSNDGILEVLIIGTDNSSIRGGAKFDSRVAL